MKSHKTKANLRRHIKNYCKMKKKMDLEEITTKQLLEAEENKRKDDIKKHELEKEKLYNQIEKLLEKVGTTNVTNNIDNSTNNQQNNIILNNFGEENLEMLTHNFMNNMIQYPFSAIPKMIKKTHFNDKHPENKNIRMLNKKDNKLQLEKITNGNMSIRKTHLKFSLKIRITKWTNSMKKINQIIMIGP